MQWAFVRAQSACTKIHEMFLTLFHCCSEAVKKLGMEEHPLVSPWICQVLRGGSHYTPWRELEQFLSLCFSIKRYLWRASRAIYPAGMVLFVTKLREVCSIKRNQMFIWVKSFTAMFVHIAVVGNNDLPHLASSEFPASEAKIGWIQAKPLLPKIVSAPDF